MLIMAFGFKRFSKHQSGVFLGLTILGFDLFCKTLYEVAGPVLEPLRTILSQPTSLSLPSSPLSVEEPNTISMLSLGDFMSTILA